MNKFLLLQFACLLLFFHHAFSQDLCKPVGWATYNGDVTGGGSATPITVTSIEEFKAIAKSAGSKVIYVKGTIGAGVRDQVDVTSDKTIIGLPGATIKAFMNLSNCNNVIIRNIIFQGPGSIDVNGVDNMTITTGTRIWIDHCEFKDGQDGNLDLKRQADYIAITWCKFTYTSLSTNHQFSNLIGHDDGFTADKGHLKITFQYNHWTSGVLERMPRVRFGQIHIVNNLFDSKEADYCVRGGREADIFVESNAFIGVRDPIDVSDPTARITVKNNITTGSTGKMIGQGDATLPPYKIDVTDASLVEALVKKCAGATLTGPTACSSCSNITEVLDFDKKSNATLLFPNPFLETTTVFHKGNFNFQIYDLNGKELQNGISSESVIIGKNLEKGIFIIKIIDSSTIKVLRFEKK